MSKFLNLAEWRQPYTWRNHSRFGESQSADGRLMILLTLMRGTPVRFIPETGNKEVTGQIPLPE